MVPAWLQHPTPPTARYCPHRLEATPGTPAPDEGRVAHIEGHRPVHGGRCADLRVWTGRTHRRHQRAARAAPRFLWTADSIRPASLGAVRCTAACRRRL